MSECAHIIDVLKRTLKVKGMTYRDLAQRVGLSEASIKRIFSEETLTLQRLEEMCGAIGMTVNELVQMASNLHGPRSQYLSIDQEELLASDPRLLACFYLLLNGYDTAQIMTRMGITERPMRALYVKLDAARLIDLQPKLKTRLRVGPVVTWRGDGPVYRLYEQQVKSEFLKSEFLGVDEALHFRSAELSEASAKNLLRRLELLAQEFADLASLDRGLPSAQKHSVALVTAFRPWVFSMFDKITKASG